MRILFVISTLGYGGANKMIVCLANHMSMKGHDVYVNAQAVAKQHYMIESNITIIQEEYAYSNYITRHFHETIRLRRRVSQIKPDIIISFLTNQNAMSVIASRYKRIPVIISERGDPYQHKSIIAKIKTMVINLAEGGVFQSEQAKKYYGKKLQRKSIIILNPSTVPYMERLSWEKRKNEIAFVARFDKQQKRQDIMVNAFSFVAKRIPDIKLVFYGAGNDENEIREMVQKMGLSERVEFKGVVSELPKKIREEKLFVMTSDYEGLPNALIEAMAVGLPCVSTDCSPGGARELIENYKNGILVPCGESKAVAEAIIWILENKEKAELMGRDAQGVMSRLNEDKIMSEWGNYINAVLEQYHRN